MSFSTNRRDALDPALPLDHRASHARSCAMLVAQKWGITRNVVIETIFERCGVDLSALETDNQIVTAIAALEDIRVNGIAAIGNA